MSGLSTMCSRLALAVPLAFVLAALPGHPDPSSGSIETAAAQAAGPGGGNRGGPGGPGRGGPGAGAAAGGQSIGHAAATASSGNDTAIAATDPTTHGREKAESVLGTTPADQNALDAVGNDDAEDGSEDGSEDGAAAESENEDFSLSQFGNQMSEDAKAALDAIAGLFSGDQE